MDDESPPRRTLQLNDGAHMPLLGLGTWKVCALSLFSFLFFFLQNSILLSYALECTPNFLHAFSANVANVSLNLHRD